MATFYFNAAVDKEWTELGNWWMSYNPSTNTYSVPATSLPTSTDNVEVRATFLENSYSEPTVVNAAFFDSSLNRISITVTGLCTFNNSSQNQSGTINGNCNFNNDSNNNSTINGNCTFNDSAINNGTITGDCTFNDSSYNAITSTINGNATFSNSAYTLNPARGTITGTIAFSSPTPVSFTLSNYDIWTANTTNWVFVTPGQNWTFNDNSFNNSLTTITGDCTFNSSSYNNSTINGNATFNDNSVNYGTINGNARFNYLTANSSGEVVDITGYASGNVSGSVTDSANNIISTWIFNNTNLISDYAKGNCIFNNGSFNNGSTINGNCTFNDNSFNNSLTTITGDCTFNSSSYNNSTINGNCNFNNDSYNGGIINGNARFNYYIADSAGRVGSNYYASGSVTGAILDANNNPISTWVFGDLGGVDQLLGTAQGDCIFYGYSSNFFNIVVGNATFYDYSALSAGFISGNATFNDNSRPEGGVVDGSATFNTTDLSTFNILVNGVARFTLISALWCVDYTYSAGFGNNEIIYDKGINGSSILGVV